MSSAKREKGHGCAGFTLTLIVVVAVILGALMFTTNVLDSVKYKLYSYAYPVKYSQEVEENAAEFGVDESLIYAVIRTESGFRPEVESYAGAVGLMQLMPETFEWLQYKLNGDVIYTTEQLRSADVNIRYGTYFLAYLIGRYGDEAVACAAYNAGAATVDTWLADSRYSSDGATLREIPYQETARYVEKIRTARDIYEHILSD